MVRTRKEHTMRRALIIVLVLAVPLALATPVMAKRPPDKPAKPEPPVVEPVDCVVENSQIAMPMHDDGNEIWNCYIYVGDVFQADQNYTFTWTRPEDQSGFDGPKVMMVRDNIPGNFCSYPNRVDIRRKTVAASMTVTFPDNGLCPYPGGGDGTVFDPGDPTQFGLTAPTGVVTWELLSDG
jgi:hypothetical protein